MNIKEITTVTLILFAIIDVVGSIPAILDIKSKTGKINVKYATIASGLIMYTFLYLGKSILNLIGIDVYSFSVAGSVMLFLIGMEMILGRDIFKNHDTNPKSTSVVPIAFPIIAGAGTLTTLISLKAVYQDVSILIGIAINLVIIFLVLNNLHRLERLLGENGLSIVRKVFGMVLLSIAIKLFSTNLPALFKM